MNGTRMILTSKAFLVLAALTFVAGCGEQTPPQPQPDRSSSTADDDGKHDHDHHHDHGHGAGPHGGTVADWGGGKFHVEFVVDHDKQEATVYIVGDDEETPVPIKTDEIELSIKDPAVQVTLKAVPQPGDPEGAASRFVGKHEKLGVVQEFAGTIIGEVEGTPYAGDFREEPHGKK